MLSERDHQDMECGVRLEIRDGFEYYDFDHSGSLDAEEKVPFMLRPPQDTLR